MKDKDVHDKTLEDTGERMIPAYHKSHMVYGEHIVRYEAAQKLVKGKTVLDIASGSGYGSALLGQTAKKVYGVDVNEDAIAYAKKNYAAQRVEFLLGDGTKIPLETGAVDIVVSFETIEHIENYEAFMKEVKRVLKPDGLLILSTPNDVEFPETNHFHIHEFKEKELEQLVGRYFKYTKSYFQGTWLYNALLTKEQLSGEWEAPINTMQTAPISTKKSIYFYMLCSNRKLTESVESLAAISEHWSQRSLQEYEQSVRKHIEEQGAIMRHQQDLLNENAKQIKGLQREMILARSSLLRRAYRKTAALKHKLRGK